MARQVLIGLKFTANTTTNTTTNTKTTTTAPPVTAIAATIIWKSVNVRL